MTDDTLLPCPFCGDPNPKPSGGPWMWVVSCTADTPCHAEGPEKETPEEAAAAWNTRAALRPAPAGEMVERLRQAARTCEDPPVTDLDVVMRDAADALTALQERAEAAEAENTRLAAILRALAEEDG